MHIPEMELTIERKFFCFQKISFELGVAISRNIEKDTCQSAVNVLKNTHQISPKTRRAIFQINFSQNDEKLDKSAVM